MHDPDSREHQTEGLRNKQQGIHKHRFPIELFQKVREQMKLFQRLSTMCCLGLFVLSFTACDTGPGKIEKPAQGEITPPDLEDGNKAEYRWTRQAR